MGRVRQQLARVVASRTGGIMNHDRAPSRKNRERRESFSGNYAKNKHIFDICVHTYQEIRSMSLVSATDYSKGRCGLEFISRWGGGPKSYFQYSRRAIGERCSPTSQLISCEP